MKYITLLFLTIFSLRGMATEYGLVTEFRQTPLVQVLKKIEQLYSVKFTYSAQIVETTRKIDLPRKERTLSELLDNLSHFTGLQLMQVGNLIGIQPQTLTAWKRDVREDMVIRGRVVSKAHLPMTGVSINVKGKTIGTTTNSNGEFTLTVEKGDQLVISSVGHEPQTFTVVDNNPLNITLQSSGQVLDEVFVTT